MARRKGDGKEAFDLIRMLQADPNTENMVDDPLLYMGNIMLLIVGVMTPRVTRCRVVVVFLNQFPDEGQGAAEPGSHTVHESLKSSDISNATAVCAELQR